MATESSFGLMVAPTRETGKEASNMAKESISQAKVQRNTESGKKENVYAGSAEVKAELGDRNETHLYNKVWINHSSSF